MAQKSEIPFGAQFSPNQVNLPKLLQLVHDKTGNRGKITDAIRDEFFAEHSPTQRWKLADNTVLALRAYGLLDEQGANPTQLASELLAIDDEAELYERFAKHILMELRGLVLVETLLAMQSAGDKITLVTLRRRLEQRGLHVPRGAVHLSSMRLWLAEAGVFDPTAKRGPRIYRVNEERLQQITGIGLDEIDRLTQLNSSQRAFLRALVRIPEADPHIANKVADLATGLYAVEYNHKDLPKTVLFPLQDLGYIEARKSTAGRDAKPYEVYRTEKFWREISDPILDAAAEKAGLVPRELFEQPLAQILQDLKSPDRHVKGRALELLALKIVSLLDLNFKWWIRRSVDVKNARIDLIAERQHFLANRWQIHCEDSSQVCMDDIAAGIGLGVQFKPNVIVIVSTGDFTRKARYYRDIVLRNTNLQLVLLDGLDIQSLSRQSVTINQLLARETRKVSRIKDSQLSAFHCSSMMEFCL